MANPWFRMYSEFATDPKVQMMSEADQRRFVMVLCLRCCNGGVTLHDQEVAFQLRISEEDWRSTKATFLTKGLITEDNNPTAWDKRQFTSDSSAERVSRHREAQRNKKKEAVTTCNVTVTPPDTDTEVNLSDDKSSLVANLQLAPPPGEPITEDGSAVAVTRCKPEPPECPHQQIIELYHELLPMCPRVRTWTNGRAMSLKTRWREKPTRQSLSWWRKFFEYVAESEFLTARAAVAPGRDPFVADLEWLVTQRNFVKVIEGKYHREVA